MYSTIKGKAIKPESYLQVGDKTIVRREEIGGQGRFEDLDGKTWVHYHKKDGKMYLKSATANDVQIFGEDAQNERALIEAMAKSGIPKAIVSVCTKEGLEMNFDSYFTNGKWLKELCEN